jgi:hypothetical protein
VLAGALFFLPANARDLFGRRTHRLIGRAGTPSRNGCRIAADQLEIISPAHREVRGLNRQHAANVRQIKEAQNSRLSVRDFLSRLR